MKTYSNEIAYFQFKEKWQPLRIQEFNAGKLCRGTVDSI